DTQAVDDFRERHGAGSAIHAGSVAPDYGFRAVDSGLAGSAAAGAGRSTHEVHKLRALQCGVRGARALHRRTARVAGGGGRGRGLRPIGLAAHHLPYHPSRVKGGPVEEAKAAVAEAMSKRRSHDRVAVLDTRPGRTASWTYRRAMAEIEGGVYIAPRLPAVSV